MRALAGADEDAFIEHTVRQCLALTTTLMSAVLLLSSNCALFC